MVENINLDEITYNNMPLALMYLIRKIDSMEQSLRERNDRPNTTVDEWMGVEGLREYLPDKPAKATIYGWVSTKQIPYHKGGKKLRFRKSEIDAWLETGKRRCEADFEAEANEYIAKREGGLKYA